jgi:hypothetical protein
MANETKPQPGNAGAGGKVGDAGPEKGQDAGGTGERGGPREETASDGENRGPSETKPPGRRR